MTITPIVGFDGACKATRKFLSFSGIHKPQQPPTSKTMNTKIDVKSALFGLAIGVLAMLAIGAADSGPSQIGRYTCAAGGGDTLLIVDSTTGRAWASRVNGIPIVGAPGGFYEKKPTD